MRKKTTLRQKQKLISRSRSRSRLSRKKKIIIGGRPLKDIQNDRNEKDLEIFEKEDELAKKKKKLTEKENELAKKKKEFDETAKQLSSLTEQKSRDERKITNAKKKKKRLVAGIGTLQLEIKATQQEINIITSLLQPLRRQHQDLIAEFDLELDPEQLKPEVDSSPFEAPTGETNIEFRELFNKMKDLKEDEKYLDLSEHSDNPRLRFYNIKGITVNKINVSGSSSDQKFCRFKLYHKDKSTIFELLLEIIDNWSEILGRVKIRYPVLNKNGYLVGYQYIPADLKVKDISKSSIFFDNIHTDIDIESQKMQYLNDMNHIANALYILVTEKMGITLI